MKYRDIIATLILVFLIMMSGVVSIRILSADSEKRQPKPRMYVNLAETVKGANQIHDDMKAIVVLVKDIAKERGYLIEGMTAEDIQKRAEADDHIEPPGVGGHDHDGDGR